MISVEKVKADLHKALERAEQTRKRTGSAEDRDFATLIQKVLKAVSAQKTRSK